MVTYLLVCEKYLHSLYLLVTKFEWNPIKLIVFFTFIFYEVGNFDEGDVFLKDMRKNEKGIPLQPKVS